MSAIPTTSRREHDDADHGDDVVGVLADGRADDGEASGDRRPSGADGPATDTPERGALDRLARRVLLLRDAEPRALIDLQGSLVLSCIRCILTYVVIPIAVPLVSWAEVVATPLSLVLSILATGMAVRSLRRVWQADWHHRWAYTAFIAVVVVLLGIGIVFDVRALLA